MRKIIQGTVATIALTGASVADTFDCAGADIRVDTQQAAVAEMVCRSADRAGTLFSACNLPALSDPVEVRVVEELLQGCVAVYHCGEGVIEVLDPSTMQQVRDPEGAFAFLSLDAYFESAIVHELAHAALDGAPCPFDACLVADEYVAYAMQVQSLPKAARAEFAASAKSDSPTSRDDLSAVLLHLSPHEFARKVWSHLSRHDDPCNFISQIVDGTVLLDRERF